MPPNNFILLTTSCQWYCRILPVFRGRTNLLRILLCHAPAVTSSSSVASVGSGFPRVVYGPSSAQEISSGYSATQATVGLSGIMQSLEQSAE